MLTLTAATYGVFIFAYLVAQAVMRKTVAAANRPTEYAARLVSILHSSVACVLTGFVLSKHIGDVQPNGSLEQQLANLGGLICLPSTSMEAAVLLHSAAYFTVDLGAMCLLDAFDRMFALHHIGAILGLIWPVLLSGKCAALIASILFLLELTNPLQHLRWLLVHEWLRAAGAFPLPDEVLTVDTEVSADCAEKPALSPTQTETVLARRLKTYADVCGNAFLASFTLARVVVGPILIYVSFHTPEVPFVMCMLGCAFFVGSVLELHRLMTLRFLHHDPTWVC